MFLTFSKQKVYYEKYGDKEKIILILPGWGNTRKTFKYLIESLKEEYTIYILDYPGEGNSSIPKTDYTVYDYVLIIKKLIKKEKINISYIIAHSFGGRLAAILISKEKIPVEKLVLMDVAGIKRREKGKVFIKEKIYKLLKKVLIFLPKKVQKKAREKLLSFFASPDYKNLPPIMHKTFQNIIHENIKKYYQEIKTETLIIWGEKDEDTPLKDAYLLRKIIKNSELIIYKNSNHFSYLDYPNQTISIINFFLLQSAHENDSHDQIEKKNQPTS